MNNKAGLLGLVLAAGAAVPAWAQAPPPTAAFVNQSDVNQSIGNNEATVNQSIAPGAYTHNLSDIDQIGVAGGLTNKATVTQSLSGTLQGADSNTANATVGSVNSSQILQNGQGNEADVLQTATGRGDNGEDASPGNWGSDITQTGTSNLATVEQHATNRGDNFSDVVQRNTVAVGVLLGNEAHVYQKSDNSWTTGSANNTSTVTQGIGNGDEGNFADVSQTAEGRTDNTSTIRQDGDFNDAFSDQSGFGRTTNASTIRQTGNLNTADLTQTSPNTSLSTQFKNQSFIGQTGNSNTATVGQQ